MNEFSEIKLGSAVTFQRGFDITKAEQSPGIVPIISSSGISSYHNKVKVKAPGVIIGRKGTLGTVHFIGQDFWPHDTTLWVKDFKGNIPQFVAYFLRTLRLDNFDTGSSNPTLNRNHIHKIKILFPEDPVTQRKIAAILTAYDDLIEVNKRRTALLEKMAEELYREWFVRLRFPGYKNTRFVKGVPEGWKMQQIEDAFEFTGGGTPSKSVPGFWADGTVNWFTPSDITGAAGIFCSDSEDRCSEEGLARSSARLFPAYSVMMTSRATIGAIGINTTPACTNQGFITCIPNEKYPLPYLYQWLKLARPYFEQLCGGATFPELTKGTFKKLEILSPTEEVIEAFTERSAPIFTTIENLLEQNQNLTKTRDLLLPRLISGKLSVEDLDIQFPPSMQEVPVEQESPPEAR
ncbi:restriction endonuclease subunit S, partial [Marinimicrobium sp. UBA4209]|uniref:restriction endonuclease subunit S n=1 Tax=Marinimicrobium sp. UBA4209 TaxID=1946810 RepID=UPI002580F950